MAESYAGGYPGGTSAEKPNNNLVWAIVAIVMCTIFGIISLIFALQVDNKWNMGDYQGAMDSAKKAKSFAMIGIILSIVGFLIWIIAIVAITALGTSVTTYTIPNN